MHIEDESKPLSTVSTESTYQKGAQIAIEIQHKIIHASKIIQDETIRELKWEMYSHKQHQANDLSNREST